MIKDGGCPPPPSAVKPGSHGSGVGNTGGGAGGPGFAGGPGGLGGAGGSGIAPSTVYLPQYMNPPRPLPPCASE